jgi:hypothetical protein
MSLSSYLYPEGMRENSPMLQLWVGARTGPGVPKGRLKCTRVRQPSLRDFRFLSATPPKAEALGYFQTSLREKRLRVLLPTFLPRHLLGIVLEVGDKAGWKPALCGWGY